MSSKGLLMVLAGLSGGALFASEASAALQADSVGGSGSNFTDVTFAHAPAPAYPTDAKFSKVEGVVVLALLVGANGKVEYVEVDKTSGDRRLDGAARKQAYAWVFNPARQDMKPVEQRITVPVTFSIGPR